jgi:hypothetical protein
MNILVFVFSLLTIFAISFHKLHTHLGISYRLSTLYEKREQIDRRHITKNASSAWSRLKSIEEKKSSKEESSKRTYFCNISFSLAPFLQGEDMDLVRFTAKILSSLYPQLWEEHQITPSAYVKALSVAAKKEFEIAPEQFSLHRIHFQDKSWQALHYQLCLQEPAVLTFTPKKSICIQCADVKILTVLFGSDVAKILHRKQIDGQKVTKEELETLLTLSHQYFDDWRFIRFSHQKKNEKNHTRTSLFNQ